MFLRTCERESPRTLVVGVCQESYDASSIGSAYSLISGRSDKLEIIAELSKINPELAGLIRARKNTDHSDCSHDNSYIPERDPRRYQIAMYTLLFFYPNDTREHIENVAAYHESADRPCLSVLS